MARVWRIMVIRLLILAAALLSAGCAGLMPVANVPPSPPAPGPYDLPGLRPVAPLPPNQPPPPPVNLSKLGHIKLCIQFHEYCAERDIEGVKAAAAEIKKRGIISGPDLIAATKGEIRIGAPMYAVAAAFGSPQSVRTFESESHYTTRVIYGDLLNGGLKFFYFNQLGILVAKQT